MSFGKSTFEKLQGLDNWIVCYLSRDTKPTQTKLDTVLNWISELKLRRTYLTYMSIDLDYDSLFADRFPHLLLQKYFFL